jgi:hypothetical protein
LSLNTAVNLSLSFDGSYSVVATTIDRLKTTPEATLFAHWIEAGLRVRVQSVEWDQFFERLLDPLDTSLLREGVLCAVFIRYEEWDHFQDYVANRRIAPSYAMVQRKLQDVIYAMECVVARLAGRILIFVLPCSGTLGALPELVAFFTDLTDHLKTSLADYGAIQVVEWAEGNPNSPVASLAAVGTESGRI